MGSTSLTDAIEALEVSLEQLEQKGGEFAGMIPLCRRNLAFFYGKLGDYEQAISHLQIAIQELDNNPYQQAQSAFTRSVIESSAGDIEVAYHAGKQAYQQFHELDCMIGMARSACLMGYRTWSHLGDVDGSIQYFLEGAKVAKQVKMPLWIAEANMGISTPYQYGGKNKKAIKALKKAQKIYDKYQITHLANTVANKLAEHHYERGDFKQALAFVNRSIESIRQMSSHCMRVRHYSPKGMFA